jgi:hypothetical protein
MIKLIKKVWNVVKPRTQKQREYDYLANSQDLADLERRQKQLIMGTNRGLFDR